MQKQSFIELSTSAFNFNIEHIKKAAKGSSIAVVLKGNAYGHGLRECALLAKQNSHVSWLCTFTIEEALFVAALAPEKHLLVLSSLEGSLEKAILLGIHMTVYTIEDAATINKTAESLGIKAFIHIKIDTGMSRLGVSFEEAFEFIKRLFQFPYLTLYGIYTHLCDTSNTDQSFSSLQLKRFDTLLELLESSGISIPCTHALSSSGLSIKTDRTYSLIRVGAFAYGIWKNEQHKQLVIQRHPFFNLQPLLLWKAPIISLKTIKRGDSVGYDRTFIAHRTTRLATVPVGYADGYPRALSNKKDVAFLNQRPLSIAGLVSMNLTTFDVTDVPEASLGSSIELLGRSETSSIYARAQLTGSISNELAVALSPTIPRIITEEHLPTFLIDGYEVKKSVSLHQTL